MALFLTTHSFRQISRRLCQTNTQFRSCRLFHIISPHGPLSFDEGHSPQVRQRETKGLDESEGEIQKNSDKVVSLQSELRRLAFLPGVAAVGTDVNQKILASATAPAPLVGPLLVKALQVLPPIAAQAAFLAPLDAMKTIKRNKSTADLPLIPYFSMALNGVLWITYGALKNDPTVWVPNITALVMGSYYWKTFAEYAPADFRMTKYYAAGTAITAGIVGTALLTDISTSTNALGLLGNAIVVAMFGGPLAAIKTVMREKSTKALPFTMTIATFVNCSLWFSYGAFVVHDPYIWFCNGLGLTSAVVQLGLFAKFGIHRDGSSE